MSPVLAVILVLVGVPVLWAAALWAGPAGEDGPQALMLKVSVTCCAVIAAAEIAAFGWWGGWLPREWVIGVIGIPMLIGVLAGLARRAMAAHQQPAAAPKAPQPVGRTTPVS